MAIHDRPAPRPAAPELVVLQDAEALAGWLLQRTRRWPKNARFTLTQRIDNHVLDVVEDLVQARYRVAGRRERLDRVNLVLERLRFLLRLARESQACPPSTFESAVRRLDAIGRMLHGWRQSLREASP